MLLEEVARLAVVIPILAHLEQQPPSNLKYKYEELNHLHPPSLLIQIRSRKD
jgi:hypothetical protein